MSMESVRSDGGFSKLDETTRKALDKSEEAGKNLINKLTDVYLNAFPGVTEHYISKVDKSKSKAFRKLKGEKNKNGVTPDSFSKAVVESIKNAVTQLTNLSGKEAAKFVETSQKEMKVSDEESHLLKQVFERFRESTEAPASEENQAPTRTRSGRQSPADQESEESDTRFSPRKRAHADSPIPMKDDEWMEMETVTTRSRSREGEPSTPTEEINWDDLGFTRERSQGETEEIAPTRDRKIPVAADEQVSTRSRPQAEPLKLRFSATQNPVEEQVDVTRTRQIASENLTPKSTSGQTVDFTTTTATTTFRATNRLPTPETTQRRESQKKEEVSTPRVKEPELKREEEVTESGEGVVTGDALANFEQARKVESFSKILKTLSPGKQTLINHVKNICSFEVAATLAILIKDMDLTEKQLKDAKEKGKIVPPTPSTCNIKDGENEMTLSFTEGVAFDFTKKDRITFSNNKAIFSLVKGPTVAKVASGSALQYIRTDKSNVKFGFKGIPGDYGFSGSEYLSTLVKAQVVLNK